MDFLPCLPESSTNVRTLKALDLTPRIFEARQSAMIRAPVRLDASAGTRLRLQRLMAQARKLYAEEDLGLDLSNTVYALDSKPSICGLCGEDGWTGQIPRPPKTVKVYGFSWDL